MSNQNENLEPKKNSEQIGINENGELVINDPQLEQALQELSPEELDEISGGRGGTTNYVCPTNAYQCGKASLQNYDQALE
uniref:Uncharacterized protein n=1 Tax=Nostoc sp. (strain PCC 8009) TaxID=29413 RepID=A0A2P0ZGQ9_NOSS8|nr:hypothetical protein [Nostoc sp. PCC 8009]